MVRDGYPKSFNTPSGICISANAVFNRVTVSVNEEYELKLGKRHAYLLEFDVSQLPLANTEVNGALKPSTERVHNVILKLQPSTK